MACGVTKTMAKGGVAVCDNLGSPSHSGLHSGITTEFWFNFGVKVRVYWSTADVTPARQKQIIRGDHFAPLPEGEIPAPEGVAGRMYTADFTGLPDSPGNIGTEWEQALGPATGRVLGESVVIPGTLGSNSGKTTWAYQYRGGGVNGRLNTDDWQITLRAVPTTRGVATDMSCSILGACSDTWGTVFECALFSGQTIKFIYNNAVRATSTFSAPSNRTYTLRRVGNVFTLWIDGLVDPLLTWTDTANIVPRGATYRRWGFAVQSNFPLFQQQYDSHGVDWITAEDFA